MKDDYFVLLSFFQFIIWRRNFPAIWCTAVDTGPRGAGTSKNYVLCSDYLCARRGQRQTHIGPEADRRHAWPFAAFVVHQLYATPTPTDENARALARPQKTECLAAAKPVSTAAWRKPSHATRRIGTNKCRHHWQVPLRGPLGVAHSFAQTVHRVGEG